MGVLTDLVIATEAELSQVPEGGIPANVHPTVDIKGIGIIELATLRDIILGLEFDPDLKAFPLVGEESEDGPWWNRLPDDLVSSLIALEGARLDDVTAQWAETEELKRDGWPPREVAKRLGEMRALAAQARQANKPVHLWTCL